MNWELIFKILSVCYMFAILSVFIIIVVEVFTNKNRDYGILFFSPIIALVSPVAYPTFLFFESFKDKKVAKELIAEREEQIKNIFQKVNKLSEEQQLEYIVDDIPMMDDTLKYEVDIYDYIINPSEHITTMHSLQKL